MIYLFYIKYINMYFNFIVLYHYGLVQVAEDDLFLLTIGCVPYSNCIILVQLNLLLVELLSYDVIVSIYEQIEINCTPIMLVFEKLI